MLLLERVVADGGPRAHVARPAVTVGFARCDRSPPPAGRPEGADLGQAGGDGRTAAFRVVRPDGEPRWLEIAARAVPDRDGRAREIVAVTHALHPDRGVEHVLLAAGDLGHARVGVHHAAVGGGREDAHRRGRGQRAEAVLAVGQRDLGRVLVTDVDHLRDQVARLAVRTGEGGDGQRGRHRCPPGRA
jgi:hypothetical protein